MNVSRVGWVPSSCRNDSYTTAAVYVTFLEQLWDRPIKLGSQHLNILQLSTALDWTSTKMRWRRRRLLKQMPLDRLLSNCAKATCIRQTTGLFGYIRVVNILVIVQLPQSVEYGSGSLRQQPVKVAWTCRIGSRRRPAVRNINENHDTKIAKSLIFTSYSLSRHGIMWIHIQQLTAWNVHNVLNNTSFIVSQTVTKLNVNLNHNDGFSVIFIIAINLLIVKIMHTLTRTPAITYKPRYARVWLNIIPTCVNVPVIAPPELRV